jgi:hypothetical protein
MPKITEMWAFISEDKDAEDEGIISAHVGMGWMPLIGADEARIRSLLPLALEIQRQTGKKVKLVKFTQRSDLQAFE